MNGFVDDELRALLEIVVSSDGNHSPQTLRVWVDTAFTGGLVIPREQINLLGLKKASSTEAILADGQLVELETFTCVLQWFEKPYRTQVIANDGQFPLLGTMLLAGRKLVIDYHQRKLALD